MAELHEYSWEDGNDQLVLKALPAKRISQKCLLGDELEMQVRAYLISLHAIDIA